ncbi:hypothetical protein HRR81_000284 [Exophiala dermatitidis]|nr:hypothetical protein HRR75_000647 [Exophiala dermatitidis]KAJ4552943.1 hypothetical protein HRR78_003202 [Exophiala dermatitidis]KAJ4558728.1 hypothetical protein HRR77_000712 [Exophiala dermatitidis]KAJ4581243.1 hypothetical protein HRR79_000287 [Exophiala dermatitidis]KAJ4584478.1 hypothetical protein HRR81_000284 [Exophiala dermatitidis]
MSQEYNIHPDLGGAVRRFLYAQIFRTPPYPTQSFAGQTVIVTGSNCGLGLEASRHFYRLGCAKLILAVRTVSKGEAAKEDIVRSVRNRSDGADAIEVWPLDLASTDSTLSFAERVRTSLPRVDAVIENAGINNFSWKVVEGGWEETIQVNVINTLLLGLLVLPKLSETKTKDPASTPHLEIVSSLVHRFTRFKEVNAPDIYAELNDKQKFAGADRYNVSKLLEILFVRELVSRLEAQAQAQSLSSPPASRISGVVITLVNPGMCVSNLDRGMPLPMQTALSVFRFLLGRSTEVGSRTLVHGACAGPTSHGEYLSECQNEQVENWIYSDVGKGVQKKVFEQTMRVLEQRKPGLAGELGL